MNRVVIEMEALPQNQMFARSAVAAYMGQVDPTVEEMTEVKTAVSEAVSNAIIHGYGKSGSGNIRIEMDMPKEDTLVVKVVDFGRGIENIDKAREPLFTTGPAEELSGMGFTVMESFMDKMAVESEVGKGTTITLMKKLDV